MDKLLDSPLLIFFLLFLLLYIAVEFGYRRTLTAGRIDDDRRHDLIVDTRNQIAVLLSLLLGFTLAMSLPRFDQRKQLVVDEANAIGTVSLRAQLLPEPEDSQVQQLLRDYAQARIEFGQARIESAKLNDALQRAKEVQNQLWRTAVAAAQKNPTPITALFVQALNETIDLDEKRLAAFENRIPVTIWIMLTVIAVLTCLTVGYGHRQRFAMSMIVPPLMIAIVMALIAELDSPHSGLIRVGQQSMHRLQSSLDTTSAPK
jgi:hypothetical protein